MAELTWNGRLLEAENALHRDIREMTTLSGEGGAIFLAAGGSGGGLMSVRITESGAARLLHELPHGRGAADIGSFGLSLIDTRAGLVALTGCRGDGTLQGRVIDSDTGRFTEAEVTVEGGLDRALALSLNGVLYAASEDSGLIWHREVPTGAAFDAGAALSGAAADRLGGIVAMAGLTDRAGADLLLTLSREGGGSPCLPSIRPAGPRAWWKP